MGGGAGSGSRANEILTHPLFTAIAASHRCSTGVVSLSWAVQRGICVIPKSSSLARIEENIKLVTLTDAEMEEINNAHIKIARFRLTDQTAAAEEAGDSQPKLMGWTNQDFGWEDAEGNWLT